jgi:dienelactone hydrolase
MLEGVNTHRDFKKELERLYSEHSRKWAFRGQSEQALVQWQAQTRSKLGELLGPFPPSVALKLERKVVAETEGYIRERLLYQTQPGIYVPAYLIIPKKVAWPVPGVLCPPGHGGGMNQVVDEIGIYKQYPLELVRRGMAVLIPEHAGFGERCGKAEEKDAQHAYYYLSLNLLGRSAIGYMLWDLMRALDVMQQLPEIDPHRIGCYGLSLGGETTLFAAAMDTRIKLACISGFLCSYQSSFLAEGHCGCGYVHGLVNYMEHVDVATLIAPRPLLIESATRDPIFPVDVAQQTYRELQEVYRLCDARDRIDQDVFEGEHEISGAKSYAWFERWLVKG